MAIMAKNLFFLFLTSALLQIPALAFADSPEVQIEKPKKEPQNLREEIDKLRRDLDERQRKEQEEQKRTKEFLKQYDKWRKDKQAPLPRELRELLSNPPPPKSPQDEIKGEINFAGAGQAIISIGSYSGVEVGQVFQVYRMWPEPEYLGGLKITNVELIESLGEFTPVLRIRDVVIRKGDVVTTRFRDE
jgi:hypothetical protein